MPIRIQPFTEDLSGGVREFNTRLRTAGVAYPVGLPDEAARMRLPRQSDRPVYQECFVAADGETIRGGYTLYQQLFSIWGNTISVGNCVMPVSEGIINRSYSLVGIHLLRDALRRQPLMFGFGMGGVNGSMTKLVSQMGWEAWPVPFYFKVVNGARFLRNFQPLRGSRLKVQLMDFAASCGFGRLLGWICNSRAGRSHPRSLQVEPIPAFGQWADQLWESARACYPMLSVRGSEVLNTLYAGRPEFDRLLISARGRPLGWAVMERNSLNRERFGGMEVAYLLDYLALPDDAVAVARAAVEWAVSRRVDLIVSNETHPAWRAALRRCGFWRGPSTFVFASSPELTGLLRAVKVTAPDMHLVRGIGDAPLIGWIPAEPSSTKI